MKDFFNLTGNKENKDKTSHFLSDEYNFDVAQSLEMNQNKQVVLDKINSEKLPADSSLKSIKDNIDHLGCVDNKCSKLDGGKEEMSNSNKQNSIYKENHKENHDNESADLLTFLSTNLDVLINLMYIFLVTLLLLNSVVTKKNNSLVHIILLTLVYVFYKIYLKLR